MNKIAHCAENREETIKEHLENVADQMKEFVAHYHYGDLDIVQYAKMTGLGHDIGKYADLFQRRIRGSFEIKVDHSTAGAIEMCRKEMLAAAFAIAGHHGGLPNGKDDTDSCLVARRKRTPEDYSDYKKEVELLKVGDRKKVFDTEKFSYAFFTRMLFSALVDADFLQTEKFMTDGAVCRGDYDSVNILYERLSGFIDEKGWLDRISEKQGLNKIRSEILAECKEKGKSDPGVFSLTVPTGGGKTIASMLFALEHAKEYRKERIIYVIPYTSIIEQNAALYREILGEKNVLEHYANVSIDSGEDENDERKKQHLLSMENWDAPVVVTTSVQFFESLFSNKSSKCRKLHNIANSVVVFDEAQMIPLFYTKPCMYAIKELVSSYAVTAVLCTATQPDFNKWLQPLCVKEICQNYRNYYEILKRTVVKDAGGLTKDSLTKEMNGHNQVLTIVNKKKTAQEIFEGLDEDGRYHLSTYMTSEHRNEVIAEIKDRLHKAREDSSIKVRVVSTSLIEAGVDVDFPCVYREKAGNDSIIQSAGRCNREGRNRTEDSIVSVFELEEERIPRLIEKNVAVTVETWEKYGCYDSLDAIQYYFCALLGLDETALDAHGIVDAFAKLVNGEEFPFCTVGEKFRLIEQNTKMLIIPRGKEERALTDELNRRIHEGESFKALLRKLGRYSLNLYETDYDKLIRENQAYEILEGVAVLQNFGSYREDIGLHVEEFICI
ncbi:MAG: CRISPR-associated helicase Cas3' [Lachnospiraceae bacterium]|nr:CRISPR-associated helicase Cas3' [Lachnospiraceae bacterium]